jgi:aminoglycoside phosphotransferase family enzyme/predicted kinase
MDDAAIAQGDVLAFLADPATYGGGAEKVRRIDTHAASVFLAGDRALKIKRAVRFPFLDFSTLEKRKRACEMEIEVNRRLAPKLYRGVVAVTRETDGRLAIGGDGAPVEWAVDMVRFDENRTLDHLANEIDDDLADALGRAVAAAHETAPLVDAEPWINALGAYIDEHVETFRHYPEIFRAADVAVHAEKSRAHYRRIVPLLRERGRRGLVRRIHGDLHLGNIALIDGEPVLFDAIEFSDVIASGDVLYDLAFLLMDLLERQRPQAANIVFNRYLAETRRTEGLDNEDLDGLPALPFFLSMRAAIRAKVTAARMERAAAAGRDNIAKSARSYFGLALRAIDPAPPQFIAVGGLSGTGKTRLARALAPHIAPMPGAVIVRSDVERKMLFGAGETEKLPAAAYAPDVTARVYAAIADRARRIVTAGHSAIVDAVFATPQERDALTAAAEAAKVPVHGLFLTAELATRIARVGGRTKDASDADASVVEAQESYDLGALTWPKIDASGTVVEILGRARAALLADPRPG